MDSNRFNQILIVDSIPSGELNTAKRLFEDIKTYANAYAPSPAIHYVRVESGDEFIQCIQECRKRANEQDIVPMLHVECHGDEDGFQFADGSFVDWDELKLPITDLNVATQLNLMIAVAACTGGALAKVIRMSDRAPFWGLIGPTKTLTAGELEKAFSALYLTLLSTKSPVKAVAAMDSATVPGAFWRTTAQGVFENVWTSYKDEYCNPEVFEIRAQRMRRRILELSPTTHVTTEQIKNQLMDHEPKAFYRYRNTFLCATSFQNIQRAFRCSMFHRQWRVLP